MIEARARVERTEGAYAWVRVLEQAGGCGRCDEPGGCRSVQLTQLFQPSARTFRLANEIGARPGDTVRLCMEEGAPLQVALASYGLGAVLAVLGAACAAWLGQGDAGMLAGVLGGLALAVVLNRLLVRSRAWRGRLSIALLGVASSCGRVGRVDL